MLWCGVVVISDRVKRYVVLNRGGIGILESNGLLIKFWRDENWKISVLLRKLYIVLFYFIITDNALVFNIDESSSRYHNICLKMMATVE